MGTTDRERHLDLLADAVIEAVGYQDTTEAWGLDSKRPFGFSSVAPSVLEIVGVEPEDDGEWSNAQIEYGDELFGDVADHIRDRWHAMRKRRR